MGRSWVRIPLSADSQEGRCDTMQKCWMVLVVHGELVTRIVTLEWFNGFCTIKHAANVCMGINKVRLIIISSIRVIISNRLIDGWLQLKKAHNKSAAWIVLKSSVNCGAWYSNIEDSNIATYTMMVWVNKRAFYLNLFFTLTQNRNQLCLLMRHFKYFYTYTFLQIS